MVAKKLQIFVLLIAALVMVQSSDASVLEFEDLTLGTTYAAGNSFDSLDVHITVEQFQWSNGVWTSDGFASVDGIGQAGGAGNELQLNNVNLDFDFGGLVNGVSLQYGEYGGNINLEVNGELVNVENFADIPSVVGGASVFTLDVGGASVVTLDVGGTSVFVDGIGALFVIGPIDSFKLGGQELWIDNMIVSIPEPATMVLLGMGGLSIVLRRRRARSSL